MSKVKSRYMDIKIKPIDKKSALQYLNDSLGVNGEEIDDIEKQLINFAAMPAFSSQGNPMPQGKPIFKAAADQIINPMINPMITNYLLKEQTRSSSINKEQPRLPSRELKPERKPIVENTSYRIYKNGATSNNDSFGNSEAISDLLKVHKLGVVDHTVSDAKQRSVPKLNYKRYWSE